MDDFTVPKELHLSEEFFQDDGENNSSNPRYVIGKRKYLLLIMQDHWQFTDRLKKKSVKFVEEKVTALEDLYQDYDVVVNCCGVRSGFLSRDTDLKPARGQAIRVWAPWLKHFQIYDDGDYYIIPGIGHVTLGGTHQEGHWNREVDQEDRKRIWAGCTRRVPSLKAAKPIKDIVGLRPIRSSVRLEKEELLSNGKKILVVNNYGHGGAGVTLHWGCAMDAAQMVQHWLLQHSKSKL